MAHIKVKKARLTRWFLQSIWQPILLYCSTCFFNMLTVKNRVKLTVGAQSQGHLTHYMYNGTGQYTPTQQPLPHYALWTQVQVPVLNEGSLWQNPSACSPKQKAK